MQFTHSHEASIGKIHRKTSVRTLQCYQPFDFVLRFKRQIDYSASHPIENRQRIAAAITQKKLRLGQHRLAGEHRRRQPPKNFPRPRVMLIISVQRGDERAGVNENSFGFDWHGR